ncbi:MAG: O-antigen ligase family protein [Spongiibacteraceae bacterium]
MLTIILVKQEWRGVKPWIISLFIALVALMSLSSLFAFNTDLALTYLSLYGKNFALALIIAGCIRNINSMRTMTLYCIAGATIGGLLAIYQYRTGNLVVSTIYDKRAGGLSNDPNDAAMLMLAGLPLCFYWFLRSKIPGKIFFSSTALITLIGIILTGSRGGFVALCVSGAIVYFRRPSIMNSVAILVIAICGIILAPPYYKDRITTLFTGKELNYATSLDQRSQLLEYGLRAFFKHPVLGTGTGNFGAGFTEIANQEGGRFKQVSPSNAPYMPAHNLYLEFFVENGGFAGCILLLIFGLSLLGLFKLNETNAQGRRPHYPLGYLIGAALIGMMLAGLFLSQGKNPVLWFLTGLGLSSFQIPKSRRVISKVESPIRQITT